MGSYHNIVKTEEIRKKVEEGDLVAALEILDTLELRKIKNISDLNLFAEVYLENERYDESAELFLKVYEKTKTRKTTGQMITVSIKRGILEDAKYYLEQYKEISPEDFEGYIFQYKVDKMKGSSYEQQMKSLETLKKIEYTEKWAYELAKLYYKAGMEKECVRECSDIILWFSEGVYVEKAKMLRSYFLGETDKDKMMEELKKRSGALSSHNLDNTVQAGEATEVLEEEAICPATVLMPENNETEAEYEEDEQEEKETYSYETENIEEERYPEVTDAESYEVELYSEETEAESNNEENSAADVRLDHLAEELGINLEGVFQDLLATESIKEQIVDCLESIISEETASVIMISSEAVVKTTLAKDLALFMYKAGKLKSPKLAKITASKFNMIDINSKKETLRNCCMIIEEAGELKKPATEKLIELIRQMQGDIAVIFEIKTKDTDILFKESPELMDFIKNRIYLP